jgi:hypothetical protein
MTTIKAPAAYDTDSKFERFACGMMEIGCIRGFYHFNRKALDAKRQAAHFLDVISRIDIRPTDLLILDVEEGGEKASGLWAWFEAARRAYANTLVLYSRANILNPIVMTAGEREYFRQIWTWPAGYPFFPDLYSVCPPGYIPDQSKFGPVGMWQYSSHGKVTGIEGDVDLNWIAPAFLAQIGTPQLGEKIMASYTGTCKMIAKVWESIGGLRTYPDVRAGQAIAADARQGEYLHLTSPVVGWSKAIWFDYKETGTPLPTPTPTPTPTPEPAYPEFVVAHYANGVTKKYVPE